MIGVGKTKSTSEKLMSIDRKKPRPKIESLPIYPISRRLSQAIGDVYDFLFSLVGNI